MVEVYAVKINLNLDKSKFNDMMAYLSSDKCDAIKKFRRFEDAQRALLGDLLIRHLICKKLKLRNDQLLFSKNEYGKPFLANSNELQYNVSHSGDWVVCAIDDLPIGIDVELQQQINFDIAKRFFSKGEYSDLMNENETRRQEYFYCLWTLKESYIKAAGKGLSIPLGSFSMKVAGDDIRVETQNDFQNCFFKRYYIDDKHKLAVCALNNAFKEEIIIKEIDELYSFS